MSKRNGTAGYDLRFGSSQRGKLNRITDVPGVCVGHSTIDNGDIQTGVTAVLPAAEGLYERPVFAAAETINGFGKATGLSQINELGEIESPILLTNTMAVGTAHRALVDHLINQHPECRTVNPVVLECNDSVLNDIRKPAIDSSHIGAAMADSTTDFQTGAIGAGRGMVCFGYKGGIGSSSRIIDIGGTIYTIGVLTLTNFGQKSELMITGQHIAPYFENEKEVRQEGSIIVVIGTDLPMEHRQLARLCRRGAFGIARTGGKCGSGSGEFVVAFSTANRHSRNSGMAIQQIHAISEDTECITPVFTATVDCIEEAIIDSLFASRTTSGTGGRVIQGLPVDQLLIDYPDIVRK